ncbi:MAG: dUTP diphosphatase [Bacillota bacterium]|nr:dUTP diphosphatase [Bacillota bacterium]
MRVEKLFSMQKELDSFIEEKHQLQQENLFDRKILALLVEIGELANETRCFKFWSVKPSSEKKIILEEFVDGIHFILSLGIECSFDKEVLEINPSSSSLSITEQFIHIYQMVGAFQKSKNINDFIQIIESYLQLASLLGISDLEIEQAYIQKNEVNYKRQHNNY